jgi:hypothetical protein
MDTEAGSFVNNFLGLDRLFQQIDFQELQSDGNFKCIG